MRPIHFGLLALALARPLPGQEDSSAAPRFGVRVEGGMLSPDDPAAVTMAYGGSVAWYTPTRGALLLRYVRQSQGANYGPDLGAHARGFLTVGWELPLTGGGLYRREARVRVGGGALFRGPLATALVVSGSLVLRYAVQRHVAFVGSVEDDAAALPRQDFTTNCVPDGSGGTTCSVLRYGGRLQHNFGFVIAAEWRP